MRWLLSLALTVSLVHGATFVVSAGVENYDDERIAALAYAVSDAQSVAAAFRASGVPGRQVFVFTSEQKNSDRRPTRINLIRALQTVRRTAVKGDRLVVFFAGHGVQVGDERYLLTVDTTPDLIADTGLPMGLVNKSLDGAQLSDVLFLIDACRNDPTKARGGSDAAMTETMARGLRPLLAATANGDQPDVVATLLACDVGQRAWEDPEHGHGVFSTYLVRGLGGAAAAADGQVHLRGLAEYVQREVRSWASRAGHEQSPRLLGPETGDMVILKPPAEPLVTVAFRNVTLSDALAQLAENFGAQVVLGKGVDPELRVNGRLENQPLGAALRVFLVAYNLQVRRQDEVYIIEEQGAVPEGPNAKPANWPDYLSTFTPPTGMSWSSFRVSPKDGMPQVLIPAGEFLMGSPANEPDRQGVEGPQRKVYVSAFWMDLHEVTVGQYRAFCEATGRTIDTGYNKEARHPVVMVSWEDATAYAQWAGRQLPTEAQWEKAARGGTATAYPWGAAFDAAKANYGGGTTPVGSYAPNGYGLYDMAGNVWEWCRDWYDLGWYAQMPARDPVNETQATYRVLRGGSWYYYPLHLRIAYRNRDTPGYRHVDFGFRCSDGPTMPKGAAAETIIVAPDGSGQYKTITEALAAAPAGAKVVVKPGEFHESVRVTKSVELVGEAGAEKTVVTAVGDDPALTVAAERVTVRGFSFRQFTEHAAPDWKWTAVSVSASRVALEDCVVTAPWGNGYTASGDYSELQVVRCRAVNCGVAGFDLWRASAALSQAIVECPQPSSTGTGYSVAGGGKSVLQDCSASGVFTQGVVVARSGGTLQIADCAFTPASGAALVVIDSVAVTVSRSRLSGEVVGFSSDKEGYAFDRSTGQWAKVAKDPAPKQHFPLTIRDCDLRGTKTHSLHIDPGCVVVQSGNTFNPGDPAATLPPAQ